MTTNYSIDSKMAANALEVLFTAVLCSVLSLSKALPCTEICKLVQPKEPMTSVCQRGCRLFSIMDFMTEDEQSAESLCNTACSEAYESDVKRKTCDYGCSHQEPLSNKFHSRSFGSTGPEEDDFFQPLLYMHSLYSNMFEKVKGHMSVQWSMYIQNGNGQLVVLQSNPEPLVEAVNTDNVNTPVGIETNMLPAENYNGVKKRMLPSASNDGIPAYAASSVNDYKSPDWLSCISGKTGLPRLILTGLVLLSAWVMIWLCLTAANTAPDIHVRPEKLSINGDVEYLKEVELQKILGSLYPQEPAQAGALPIKVRVERI